MCTVITREQEDHPQIAERDLKVYKGCLVAEDYWSGRKKIVGVRSIYQFFIYVLDRLYEVELRTTLSDMSSDETELDYTNSIGIGEARFVTTGFHALTTPDKERLIKGEKPDVQICEFIIPKGAEYYQNPVGNIVSNQIIFKGLYHGDNINLV